MGVDARPLEGLRILDASGMVAGGFATSMLADFGADVVTIEHPQKGDPIRDWGPMVDGESIWWKSLGRNKRSITINLKSDEGRELTLDLAKDVDVFFENFTPGTLEEWGLGYEDLKAVNEGIIMVRISGYGQTGPKSKKPGFGTVAEAISGWAQVNGFPDTGPLLPPISLADLTTGQFAIQGTMFAIFERDLGLNNSAGEGQVVDVSLYESLFRLFISDVEKFDQCGIVPERLGNRHESAAPRNVYETEDGYVAVSASAQSIFENLLRAMGREDLKDDPRFVTNERRLENITELDGIIESWTESLSTDAVLCAFDEHDAVGAPIYGIEDIFVDEQYLARGNIIEVHDSDLGTMKTQSPIPRFTRTPGTVEHTGPDHGEHTEEVLRGELGLSKSRYNDLKRRHVI